MGRTDANIMVDNLRENVGEKEGMGERMKKAEDIGDVWGEGALYMLVGGDGGVCGPSLGAYYDPHLALPSESYHLELPGRFQISNLSL